MDGMLLVDKPADWTSHDVVAKVRGMLEKKAREEAGERVRIKVGHAGTLDPFATGLLILLIGKGTKHAQNLLKLDKTYEVEIILGATSDTDDKDGNIVNGSGQLANDKPQLPIANSQLSIPSEQDIHNVLKKLTGTISQIPPQFSAIKKNGKRAYKSARKGEHIELEPRNVTIYSIENVSYEWPKLNFITSVSSGTYIRSLARDIGQKLGTGAYVNELRRTQIGTYSIEQSTPVDELNYEIVQKTILPLDK